jgi:hypothetical protein
MLEARQRRSLESDHVLRTRRKAPNTTVKMFLMLYEGSSLVLPHPPALVPPTAQARQLAEPDSRGMTYPTTFPVRPPKRWMTSSRLLGIFLRYRGAWLLSLARRHVKIVSSAQPHLSVTVRHRPSPSHTLNPYPARRNVLDKLLRALRLRPLGPPSIPSRTTVRLWDQEASMMHV